MLIKIPLFKEESPLRKNLGKSLQMFNIAYSTAKASSKRAALLMVKNGTLSTTCLVYINSTVLFAKCPSNTKGESQEGMSVCSTSQQQASASQGPTCSDSCTCGHTEIEVADQTFYLTHSQHTDTAPTSPSVDPITPGAWQGSHWSASLPIWCDSTWKKIPKARMNRTPRGRSAALEAGVLTTRPTRRSQGKTYSSLHILVIYM